MAGAKRRKKKAVVEPALKPPLSLIDRMGRVNTVYTFSSIIFGWGVSAWAKNEVLPHYQFFPPVLIIIFGIVSLCLHYFGKLAITSKWMIGVFVILVVLSFNGATFYVRDYVFDSQAKAHVSVAYLINAYLMASGASLFSILLAFGLNVSNLRKRLELIESDRAKAPDKPVKGSATLTADVEELMDAQKRISEERAIEKAMVQALQNAGAADQKRIKELQQQVDTLRTQSQSFLDRLVAVGEVVGFNVDPRGNVTKRARTIADLAVAAGDIPPKAGTMAEQEALKQMGFTSNEIGAATSKKSGLTKSFNDEMNKHVGSVHNESVSLGIGLGALGPSPTPDDLHTYIREHFPGADLSDHATYDELLQIAVATLSPPRAKRVTSPDPLPHRRDSTGRR